MKILNTVALKRQQAAEDAIALHLASAESGTTYDYLPPGRIYGMQVTSPEPDSQATEPQDAAPEEPTTSSSECTPSADVVTVSPASIEMLTKLFPNKKRSVLELVLKRCNHDLLKAIEHFNVNAKSEPCIETTPSSSAFKPVKRENKNGTFAHQNSISLMAAGSKVFMHSLYPFLPLFNSPPVLPSPVYVPGFCECEQCKHGIYRMEPRV